jgi:hypothetical protein
MKKKPLEVRVDEKLRLEVDRGHFFNIKCKCMACLSIWLGVESGAIVVKNHDGTRNMVFPRA